MDRTLVLIVLLVAVVANIISAVANAQRDRAWPKRAELSAGGREWVVIAYP